MAALRAVRTFPRTMGATVDPRLLEKNPAFDPASVDEGFSARYINRRCGQNPAVRRLSRCLPCGAPDDKVVAPGKGADLACTGDPLARARSYRCGPRNLEVCTTATTSRTATAGPRRVIDDDPDGPVGCVHDTTWITPRSGRQYQISAKEEVPSPAHQKAVAAQEGRLIFDAKSPRSMSPQPP